MNTILFDVETTGFLRAAAADISMQPQIIELAAVKIDDDFNIIEEFDQLINPGKALPAEITKITGITDSMLEEKPSFQEIIVPLTKFFFGGHKLVAHNVQFDVGCLKYELQRIDRMTKFPWPPNHVCTVEKSMYIKGHRLKLGDLYEIVIGKKIEHAHRAMNDVKALLEVYKFLHAEHKN